MSVRNFFRRSEGGSRADGREVPGVLVEFARPRWVGCAVHELIDTVALTPGAAMSESDANREVHALFYDGRGRFSDPVQIGCHGAAT